MDKFDEKLKQMAQSESWEIPDNIDSNISRLLNDIDKPKKAKKKPLKVAVLVASISLFTITTAFAIENIIEYFNYNKESAYISSQEELTTLGNSVNLSIKENGIEFTIDSISVDANYINVFYTIKSDKTIEYYYKILDEKKPKEADSAKPFIFAEIDGEPLKVSGINENEATYISENELKGMERINAVHHDIKNSFDIKIYTDEIFGEKGNWSISTKVDKSKAVEKTRQYNINKDIKIKESYDLDGKDVNITHKLNIDKITLSPFANQIVIKEKVNQIGDYELKIGGNFALFDDENNSLDILDKGLEVDDTTGMANNTFEFLKANIDTKYLTFVPIGYTDIQEEMIEPQDIDNLPIVLEMNEYGKIVIENIEITDKQIKYTYYKDGVVMGDPSLWFLDEEGKEIQFSYAIDRAVNRHTGRHTITLSLEGHNVKPSEIAKIKKITTYNNNIKLRYDESVKIELNS